MDIELIDFPSLEKCEVPMKRILKVILILLLLAALVLGGLTAFRFYQRGFWPSKVMESRSITGAAVAAQESASVSQNLTKQERCYTLDNGDQVSFGRICAGESSSSYHMVRKDILSCETATVWYYDAETKFWNSTPLEEMELGSTCIYIDGATQDYYYYPPIGYQLLENNSLRENVSHGYLSFEKTGMQWELRLFGPTLQPGEVGDYTVVSSCSEEPLLDTTSDNTMKNWANYCQDGDGRWCYDGYYFPADISYIPSGDGCLYRCVDAYLVKSMTWQTDLVRLASDFLLTMLDTMSLQQNEEGYFPTLSGSTWLMGDYGIPAGFYDTRFNADLMLIFYEQIKRTGGFEETIDRYFDFYLSFAEAHHYETENGGYLVWDYNNSTSPVHCSLNHQLTEMLVLYRYGLLLDRPHYIELADKMLLGIEDAGTDWLMEDGSLHYSRLPDGSFGLLDYPYLTYNDMFIMQQELTAMGRQRSAMLDTLMESKLAWMQANGVTGYKR